MKYVIINGDDYGYTDEKNEGILKAHSNGILTSTTVMVNMVTENWAKEILKHRKSLGIGLHLNITSGKPVSQPNDVPTLVNKRQDMFRPEVWNKSRWNNFGNQKNVVEVEMEYRNQLKRFNKLFNMKPSHLDSHHFMTSHERIFPILIKLAKENGLPIRLPGWIVGENHYELVLSMVNQSKVKCKTSDYAVYEFFYSRSKPLETFINALKTIKDGITEFMFHPSISGYGKIDLGLLTHKDVKRIVSDDGIKLIDYRNLA
ncbi:MAG: hypothetical protein A2W23_09370 [Planctomycetes bacterium RBG_16_43_13]|nr:MAG: hypothetical protein A2W23_09370 [Planctomycetes bacterium RBG_16_43_13]